MRSTLRAATALFAAATLIILSASPAEAGARRTLSRDITTGGTLALRGRAALTFDDRDSVSDIDLSITDYKCDGRGGHVRAWFLIRERLGGGNFWAPGSLVWSGGCGTTRTDNNNYPIALPVRDVYSAKIRVCFDNAGCFDSGTVDNPYN